MIKCYTCKIEKPESCFHNDKRSKTGKRDICKPCCTIYRREHYRKNKEVGRQQVRMWQAKNPDKVKKSYKKWATKNPLRLLYKQVKMRAKQRGWEFSLVYEDLKVPETCPILGIPLFWKSGRSDNSPSVDRINSKKGYTPENVQVISWRANRIKNDATPEELTLIANYMKGKNA